MKPKLNQPDMFPDTSLIVPKPGTDAGLQADIFGGVHLHQTMATEAVKEAATTCLLCHVQTEATKVK